MQLFLIAIAVTVMMGLYMYLWGIALYWLSNKSLTICCHSRRIHTSVNMRLCSSKGFKK